MGLQPQDARGGGRVNPGLDPPRGLIAAAMDLAMVSAAERDSEFIAHLAAQCRWLGKAQMVGIGWAPATDETRLLSDRFDMLPVADPTRHG